MSDTGREIEAKFYLLHQNRVITRLQDLQARLIQPRVLEMNLRFDLPDGSLRADGRVLRLRHDSEARLTYKGPGKSDHGVLEREEIEFIVEDFERARQFLEALGYQKTMLYEKFRTTYELHGSLIMVDELPYGNFVEIEGTSMEEIRTMASALALDWSEAISMSYTSLFETAREALELTFEDISFKNFEGIHVTVDDLSVRAADG